MYSAKKIQKTIEAFEKREGWSLTPHTLDEVNEFKEYVNSIVKIGSNSKNSWIESVKPLSEKRQREVARWIENEQALCSIDSGYFESRYVYIVDEYGQIKKFQNRKSQEVIDSIISDLDDRELGIELLILGSRQNGATTKILLKLLHRTMFVPNTQTILSSAMNEKCDYMKQVLDIVYDKLPFWIPPIKMPKGSFNNQSRIIIQSGMRASGIAQGFTPNCVYLTNVDQYLNPVKTIEDGLLRAMFTSSNTFLVLDGMKEYDSSWLSSTYKYAKKYWDQGKFRFCPLFIPWTLCTDIYPTKEWLKRYPIPSGWKASGETLVNKRKCEVFIRTTPNLARIVGNDWSMSREQQWFWEFNYCEAKLRGALESFEKHFSPDDGVPSEERKEN